MRELDGKRSTCESNVKANDVAREEVGTTLQSGFETSVGGF